MSYIMNFITIDYLDNVTKISVTPDGDYRLKYAGWTPRIARRRMDGMGGVSPYEDVEENPIELIVTGSSPAIALNNLTALSTLFDQAESWGPQGRQTDVNPIRMQYLRDGSALSTPPEAVIWGLPDGSPILTLHQDFSDNRVFHVTLTFMRRGLWLGDTESDNSTTSSGNPAKQTITNSGNFSNSSLLLPYDYYIEFSNNPSAYTAYLALVNNQYHIGFEEAEDRDGTSNMTSHADTNASGGNTMITDTGAASFYLSYSSGGWIPSGCQSKIVDCYAMLRNNSSTKAFDIYIDNSEMQTSTVRVSSDDNNPQVVYLGRVSTNYLSYYQSIIIYISTADGATVTAGNELEVDYFVFVADDECTRVLEYSNTDGYKQIHIEHQLDDRLNPRAYSASSGSYHINAPYKGDAVLVSAGTDLYGIVFGHRTGNYWVIEDSGGTELNTTMYATRTKGYLTPP